MAQKMNDGDGDDVVTVPSGAGNAGQFDPGDAQDGGDDNYGKSNGTPGGYANCVPSGGKGWPTGR